MKVVELDGIIFRKAKKDDYKYQAEIPVPLWNRYRKEKRNKSKIVYFGDKNYQHFYDKIGLFKKLDHKDPKRKELYEKRHRAVMVYRGEPDEKPSIKLRYSPAWFSKKYLW